MSGAEQGGVRVQLPVETGEKDGRKLSVLVRERSKCRACSEEILRISSKTENVWIHRGRVLGKPYDHPASHGVVVQKRPQSKPYDFGKKEVTSDGAEDGGAPEAS